MDLYYLLICYKILSTLTIINNAEFGVLAAKKYRRYNYAVLSKMLQ